MDTLTEPRPGVPDGQCSRAAAASCGLRWMVMQSLKHGKWVLAVVRGTFEEYRVTDLMSENVELMIQCADYLNRDKAGSALDAHYIQKLERLKSEYGASECAKRRGK